MRLNIQDLAALFESVKSQVDEVYGPRLRDGAVALEVVRSLDDLPRGYRDEQTPGRYRLVKEGPDSFFGYVVGPQSLKKVLAPARRKLWEVRKSQDGQMAFAPEPPPQQKLAFFGIRACDIKALAISDKVYEGSYPDEYYQALRQNLFLVTATCHTPSQVCFCTSMGYGPKADSFDLNITEVVASEGDPYFLVEAGSDRGQVLLDTVGQKPSPALAAEVKNVYQQACEKITKTMPGGDTAQLLKDNLEHTSWDEIAERCLSCGNCTAVCPTCFCSTTYDVNDLEGDHSERWLRQDSCFTADISYIHGGAIRPSTRSRYRQWLTHKLSTWWEQFGTSGCVGCGRCVSWCPVGIDLTEQVQAIKEKP